MKNYLILALSLSCVFCGIGESSELIPSQNVKIVVFVPESHTDVVRKAMGDAGAGRIGNYDHCSFTIKGIGSWRPLEGAHPASGEVGKISTDVEDRIEAICPKDRLDEVLAAIRKVHPYDKVGFDLYPMLDLAE